VIGDPQILLPLAVLWPLLLSILSIVPGLGQRMTLALPLSPLPALAAAFLAPREVTVAVPGVLLDGGLELTASGALFLGGAATVWFWAGVYAAAYMRRDERRVAFCLFWNLVLTGNLGVFLAADVVSFYVFFALVSLMAYPLVIHDRQAASLRAGSVYIVLAILGEAAILVAFMLAAHGAGGAIWIVEVRASLALPGAHPAILWLLIAGFGIKAGLVPLHVWLPLAHPAAPTPASAVLSGAIVKAGIFGLVVFLPFGTALAAPGLTLAVLSFAGLFAAALVGVAQTNAKAVLAYSTVSQMGLVMGVLGLALAAGMPATSILPVAALYALHHGLAKGALFLGAGLAASAGGVWRVVLMVALALLALSVAGLPLTAGALAKSAMKGVAGGWGGWLIGLSALTSGLVLARFLIVLAWAEPHRRPGLWLMLSFLALGGTGLWLPWVLVFEATGQQPDPLANLQKQLIEAWPLVLAGLMVAVAATLQLRPPQIPEGDLLAPVMRAQSAARAAFRAAFRAGTQSLKETPTSPTSPLNDDLKAVEAVIMDRAATAIFLMFVVGAILAAAFA